jgi:signal transduction histidine kinase
VETLGLLLTLAMAINSLAMVLSLTILIQLLWIEPRNPHNMAYAFLILMFMVWASGTLLSRLAAFVDASEALTVFGLRLMMIGFLGVCAGLYLFALTLTGAFNNPLHRAIILLIFALLAGQVFFSGAPQNINLRQDRVLIYGYDALTIGLYSSFALAALVLMWDGRNKTRVQWLNAGFYLIIFGVLTELFLPELRYRAISANVMAIGALVISYAMLKNQVIDPLAGRATQLQAVRDVGVAITSRLQLEDVLGTIAAQAASILSASGAAIFLKKEDFLELAAVYQMPSQFIGHQVLVGQGLAGMAARNRSASRVEFYPREWPTKPDVPFAGETFGAVVAAPLILADEVMGVLLVAEGHTGKRFDRTDLNLLELLAPQAAVAIGNSRLFTDLKQADEQKTQMLHMTSHQLKNPLFVATSSAELLLDDASTLNPNQLKDVNKIWQALERMERIVHTILNLESVQTGAVNFEEVALPPLLRSVVAEYEEQATERGITLGVQANPDLPSVWANQHYLRQAISNLVENALKFTLSNGQVLVQADPAEETLIIRVRDTGIGIPPDALSRVFERFFRARQPGTDHISGTGLGLSLVKAVIDAHQGRIWVESEAGKGTLFTIALPIYKSEPVW